MSVRRDKAGEVRAGDIVTDPAVLIANPDHKIATLTANVPFQVEMNVRTGRGYATINDNRAAEQELGVIPIDSIFSPVLRVRYRTEDMRVGQRTNYDRLIMEIWTKGTVRPEDALVEAGLILRKHLNPFVMYHEMGDHVVTATRPLHESEPSEGSALAQLLAKPVATLELSVRASNCLEAAQVLTLRDLVTKTESDLLRFRSFGKTSLHEVQRKLSAVGLSLGMRFGEERDGAEDSGDADEAPIAGLTSRFGHPDAMGADLPAGPGGSVNRGGTGPMEVFTMGD